MKVAQSVNEFFTTVVHANDVVVVANVSVATMNVLSLLDGKEAGLREAGKAAVLQKQMSEASVHLIGVQEARSSQGQWCTEHFLVLASECAEGRVRGMPALDQLVPSLCLHW